MHDKEYVQWCTELMIAIVTHTVDLRGQVLGSFYWIVNYVDFPFSAGSMAASLGESYGSQ